MLFSNVIVLVASKAFLVLGLSDSKSVHILSIEKIMSSRKSQEADSVRQKVVSYRGRRGSQGRSDVPSNAAGKLFVLILIIAPL